jgi:Fur family ferric uptake transcriptional regulator
MSCESETELAIREGGRRLTGQRLRVAVALRHAGGHRSAEEVRDLVAHGRRSDLPLSTVYRALDALKALRLVSEVAGESHAEYEWVDAARPHHHLVCERCGAEQPLDPALIDSLHERIRSVTGFSAHLDHVALPGLCRDCAEASR